MQTQHPRVIRRGFLAVVLLVVVVSIVFVSFLASAMKTEKEKGLESGPVNIYPIKPGKPGKHPHQIVGAEMIRDSGGSVSMLPVSTSAPSSFLSEADLKQKQQLRR